MKYFSAQFSWPKVTVGITCPFQQAKLHPEMPPVLLTFHRGGFRPNTSKVTTLVIKCHVLGRDSKIENYLV